MSEDNIVNLITVTLQKRIGDVSRQKKAGKSSTFQSSYEQNVHLYLRSLYNKKLRSEKAMVSRYHDQSEHRPYGKQQVGSCTSINLSRVCAVFLYIF